jgi:3-dehydroquinate synthase
MAEVIKYGLMADPRLWARLEKSDLPTMKKNPRFLEDVVAVSAGIKADVVARDERETTGLRATLNLGHTFAHAIETVSGYTAIPTGKPWPSGCARRPGWGPDWGCSLGEIKRVDDLVRRWGLPVRVSRPLPRADIRGGHGSRQENGQWAGFGLWFRRGSGAPGWWAACRHRTSWPES